MNRRYDNEYGQKAAGVIVLLISMCCGTWFYHWWFSQQPFEGLVSKIYWDYGWDVLEWRAVEKESMTINYPENSYAHWSDTDCTTTTRRNSNGTTSTSRSCDTDYYYTINEWVVIRTDHTTGEGNQTMPYYPTLVLNREYGTMDCPESLQFIGANSPAFDCQKPGNQHPVHYFDIHTISLDEDFDDTCTTGFGRWTELGVENIVSGMYFNNRKRIDCETIHFARLEEWYTEE